MTGLLRRERSGRPEAQRLGEEGRREDGGRDWRDVGANQAMPWAAGHHQKQGETDGAEGTCQHLTVHLRLPEVAEVNFCCFQPQILVVYHGSRRKLIHIGVNSLSDSI